MKHAGWIVVVAACGGVTEGAPSVRVPPQPPAPLAVSPGPAAAAPAPVARAPRSPAIASLSRGTPEPTCGLDGDGAIWCWRNMHYAREAPSVRGARVLAEGPTHACVLDAAGVATCWGQNGSGQLGDGKTYPHRDDPRPVPGLPPVAEILALWERTCARTTTGDVLCWGDRSWGKAGDGTLFEEGDTRSHKTSPGTPIVKGATAIASGMDHVCAAFGDGSVQCWGGNLAGQSGHDRIHPPTPRPTMVRHAKDVVALAAFEGSTCSIDKVGDVRCWGNLGDPSVSPAKNFGDAHPSPRRVALPSPAVEIAVGASHACARLADGKVSCWGDKDAVRVPLPEPATQVAAGLDEACALVRGGRVFCWPHDHPTEPAEVGPPEE